MLLLFMCLFPDGATEKGLQQLRDDIDDVFIDSYCTLVLTEFQVYM